VTIVEMVQKEERAQIEEAANSFLKSTKTVK
jgi:hypothetical protein